MLVLGPHVGSFQGTMEATIQKLQREEPSTQVIKQNGAELQLKPGFLDPKPGALPLADVRYLPLPMPCLSPDSAPKHPPTMGATAVRGSHKDAHQRQVARGSSCPHISWRGRLEH